MLTSNLALRMGLREVNYRLLSAILLTLLIPTLYNTFRIYLIADIPNTWGFSIASQIAWLNVIYEVLQEGITLPLFYVLGAVASTPNLFFKKLTLGLRTIIPLYCFIALILWLFSGELVVLLNQSPELVEQTTRYIRLESIAIPLRVVTDIALIALITISAKRRILFFVLFQLLVRILSDYIFLTHSDPDLGVIAVGYSTIVINSLTALTGVGLLYFSAHKVDRQHHTQTETSLELAKWLKISLLSGAESGIRNGAFVVMILKLANEVGESGTLWITNGFIWGWLLLPILALGTLIKQDVGVSGGVIGKRFNGYVSLTALIILLWLVSIPLWATFIKTVMGIDDPSDVNSLSLLFLGFYIFFAFNNILDSYLYGMGRTDLMLYQSMLVNLVYYAGAFILYQRGIFIPSLQSIALLFGGGIMLDFIATVVLFKLAKYPKIK